MHVTKSIHSMTILDAPIVPSYLKPILLGTCVLCAQLPETNTFRKVCPCAQNTLDEYYMTYMVHVP